MKKPAAALLIAALALAPPAAGAGELTPQKEKDIGRRFHLQAAASGALVTDPIVTGYFKAVTDRVSRAAGLKPGQLNFYIVRRDGINAFAIPGGYIYVHTETLHSLENEGQLASILSHETAHITARHFARRLENSSAMTVASIAALLAGILVASRGGGNAGALGQALMFGGAGAGAQNMLANSREDEADADAKGRGYLIKAGYQPRDMYGAFKIMADKTFQLTPDLPTYLTTHPALTSRLAASFSDAEKTASSPPDLRYTAFRDRVLAGYGEIQRARNEFTRRLNASPKDHSALHGLGLIAQRQQSLGQADRLMRQALEISPNNQEYLADLGDLALKRRRPEEARSFYEKAGPRNRLAVLGLARASELMGDRARAGTMYDQALNLSAEDYPEALELAGRFFGQTGQKDKGHYYLGRYFASLGNIEQAVFHYRQVGAGRFQAQAERELKLMTELKKDARP